MFDDDDQFDLTDDPFEWDLLLDDDELEQRIVRNGRTRKLRVTLRKRKTSAAADCSVGSLDDRRIAASVYLARVERVAK